MIYNTKKSYGSVAKFFHWLIFFLVAILLFVGFYMQTISDKTVSGQVFNVHKLTGITVLFLMILRLLWMLMNPKPQLPAGTPRWQHAAEFMMHWTLYALLIAMPLCGWIGSVAGGYVPHFFNWKLSLPIAKNKALDEICFDIHNTLAFVIIALVILHISAAIYHHVIKKDNILLRMMPGAD